MGGIEFAHRAWSVGRLVWPAMTKQHAIAACDHGAGIPEQGFDRMAGRGCLPVVTIECAGTKHHLRDLLLGGAIAIAVEALQHPTQSRALLQRQSRVRWHSPCVKGREKATDRFKPIEPLDAEWHERGERGAVDDLAVRRVRLHRQRPRVHPAADGVVADAEQSGGLGDPEVRHDPDTMVAPAGVPRWIPRTMSGSRTTGACGPVI